MNDIPDNAFAIMAVIVIFVVSPIAIAFARLIWKRTSEPRRPAPVADDTTVRRMAELQQSMDAMAVEIERIAEGQRFVTKLMSERPAAEIPAGATARSTKGR